MKKTPLHQEHIKSGARMVDFAGWEMPVLYTSIIEEHKTVRAHAGIFDVSHMGEIRITGAGSEQYLRSIIPTSMDKLYPGKSMYSCLCREDGGVIDDIFIFMESNESYYIVVNAGTITKDLEWFRNNCRVNDVEITDLSDETAKIDIQGPSSPEILNIYFNNPDINNLSRFHFIKFQQDGVEYLISKTGYTGETGYEIFTPSDKAGDLWIRLMQIGVPLGLVPAGLGARDSLRLEACYSLYGHEISDEISPVEAGLSWLISSEDDYIGKKILEKQKNEGSPRELICFELMDKGIAREKDSVYLSDKKIGFVTSGAYSPILSKPIGMALVESGQTSINDELKISIRGKEKIAKIVQRPFYKFNG